MKNKFLILVTWILPLAVMAQSPSTFTMQEAIDYALVHNTKILSSQKSVLSAEFERRKTIATGLPQITGDLSYNNWLKQQVSLIPAEFFGGNPGEFAAVTFGTKQSAGVSAELNQQLFNGSYLVGLQASKVYLAISENAKEKLETEVVKATTSAYANSLMADESIRIAEKNLGDINKNLKDIEGMFAEGMIEEESVEQLRVLKSSVEANYSNGQRMRDLAYNMLKLVLGLKIDDQIMLQDNLDSLAHQNLDLTLLEQGFKIEDNVDFRIAKNQEESSALLLKLEKSKALPQLNAFINAGYNGFNNEFKFTETQQQWFGYSMAGIRMSVPIFSSLGRQASTNKARMNLDIAQIQLEETQQRLFFELESAKSNFQYAIETYYNNQESLLLAERISSKNQVKFLEGIASSFDLLQAQKQLYEAQYNYLNSMTEVINKKTVLDTILNNLSN
ncbi:MAG: TolC family protein [Flavobacteriaceae bacterium]|jgi:outer membrane protein TolC|nr:TolC family protein [Flavobacteriaceae bacterium]